MTDLYLSLALMGILCGVSSTVGASLAVCTEQRIQRVILLIAGLSMGIYLAFLWDRPILTRWLPWSSAIILGNWLPVIACFLIGVCLRTKVVHLWRRLMLSTSGVALAGYSLLCPVLGDPPACLLLDTEGTFQIQTCEDTCSAASAASLLRMHGIHTNEGEMARLCLTRSGTHWLGVYRGLKLKTAGTAWDVVAADFHPLSAPGMSLQRPGVLSLAFSSNPGAHILASGFRKGAGHSVVLLEHSRPGEIRVYDPSPEFGFETWGQGFLQDVRSAVLLQLVPRDPEQEFVLPANELALIQR